MKRINITCPACGSRAYLRPASVVYGDKAPDPDAKYYVCGRYGSITILRQSAIFTLSTAILLKRVCTDTSSPRLRGAP